MLSYPALGIELGAPTREHLLECLLEELDLLWRGYAECPPERLTPGGQRLRAAVRAAMTRSQ